MKLNEAERERLTTIAQKFLRTTVTNENWEAHNDLAFLLKLLKDATEGRVVPEEGFHRVRIAVVTSAPRADGFVDWSCAGWEVNERRVGDEGYDADMARSALDCCDALVTQISFVEADVPLPISSTIEGRVS